MADAQAQTRTLEGGCLCSGARYRIRGRRRRVCACQCRQCRKTSGHFVAATAVARDGFDITEGKENLAWYESSPGVHRGFCGTCGSNLFWDRASLDLVAVMAGSLDEPTGLTLSSHTFTAYKGDYYQIADDLPQKEER